MPAPVISDAVLNRLRGMGDPAADRVVASLTARGQLPAVNKLLRRWVYNDQPLPSGLPAELVSFIDQARQLPPWADTARISAAAKFGQAHMQDLALAYSMGVSTTAMTFPILASVFDPNVGILLDFQKRLIGSLKLISGVYDPDAFGPHGQIIPDLVKVRLMHAAVRDYLDASRWDTARWGVAISQEAGLVETWLYGVFAQLVMRAFGVQIPPDVAADFLHTWRVEGVMLGVPAAAMPSDMPTATALFYQLEARDQGASPQGRFLLNSFIDQASTYLSGPGGVDISPILISVIRCVLGTRAADMLAVPKSGWDDEVASALQNLQATTTGNGSPLSWFAQVISDLLGENVQMVEVKGQPVYLDIPSYRMPRLASRTAQGGRAVALPDVDLKPAVVTPGLASAALASPALSRAVKLAEWVGDGREITDSGVLRPAVAEQACKDLGIDRPDLTRKLRSAQDVPGLVIDWNVARLGGLITLHQKRARGMAPDGPGAVLDAWLRAVSVVFGLPDESCGECLTALAAIAQAENCTIRVAHVLEAVFQDLPAAEPCPDCGGSHAEPDAVEAAQHVASSLEDLMFFGAATLEGSGDANSVLTLTPLGRMLADSVFAQLAPAPEDSAIAVAAMLADLSGPTAFRYAAAWLAARTPAEAVTELLDAAQSATPRQRLSAIDLAAEVGPQAAPVWRERAQAPGYGAQIRSWLTAWGEEVPNFPRDDAWLMADELSAVYEVIPPDVTVTRIRKELHDADRGYTADLLTSLGESGHPDAPRLIELVRTATNPRRPAAEAPSVPLNNMARPLQLMITLREVDDPPVWRRVVVSGSTPLEDLHYIIQAAMGWENDHPHAFYAGRRELAGATPLRDVLPKRGSSCQYLYDFGDDWTHDIKSEGLFHNDKRVTLPACLDGSGACPPEDSGDFDPSAFSLDEANARLAGPSPDETAGPPAVTIVRAQPRTKKPKSKR